MSNVFTSTFLGVRKNGEHLDEYDGVKGFLFGLA